MGNFFINPSLTSRKHAYSDTEVVLGLQSKKHEIESWFYSACKSYFMDKFSEIFFDLDKKQEVFQTAFVKLWSQIDNQTIRVKDSTLQRQRANGLYDTMTCSLTTFLMAIAKNEYREIVRNNKEEYYAEYFENEDQISVVVDFEDEAAEEEQKNRIVSECINKMPSRCIEILTLFYYEGKSLDEILAVRKDKNSSKEGLRVAKSKCMSSLKELILHQFERYHLYV